ncbi:MAG: Na+/H+ antiporter NhaA [Acidimicrobiia bacterium]
MPEERIHSTWLNSDAFVPRRFLRPALRFTQIEAASGVVLLAAAIIALVWANLDPESYQSFWNTEVSLELGPLHVSENLKGVVNDGLMTLFFFVVGLEIKRELAIGELRDPRAAALPVLAAVGGMLVPAAIYLAFNAGTGEAARGWAIPSATDIAFAVGVVTLLGNRVPTGAKLFLLTLAVADDIGGVTIIAVFYSSDVNLAWLVAAVAGLIVIWTAGRSRIRSFAFYVPMGFFVWFATLESGIEAALAGVALGLLAPARPLYSAEDFDNKARQILEISPTTPEGTLGRALVDHEALLLAEVTRESVAPLNRLEHRLVGWSSFVVVPIFALANAGVHFGAIDMGEALTHPVTLGVFFGLVVGKIVGVTGATAITLATKLGKLPHRVTWRHIVGVSALAGIGFTVAIFVTEVAFTSPEIIDFSKIGIFGASLVAGVLGYLILRIHRSTRRAISSDRVDEPAPTP